MRTILHLFLVGLLMSNLHGSERIEKNVIVVSPHSSVEELNRTWKTLQRQCLIDSPGNSHFRILDGWELTLIAEVKIPDSMNKKLRISQVAPALNKMKSWFVQAAHSKGPLKGTGIFRFPEFIDLLQREVEGKTAATLVGSPFVVIPSEPELSFYDPASEEPEYVYPSDYHMQLNRLQSPYGLVGREDALKGMTVHLLYKEEGIFKSLVYKQQVHRFWALWFETLGASLFGFGADCNRTFSDVWKVNLPKPAFELNENDTTLEMRNAQRPDPTEIQAEQVHQGQVDRVEMFEAEASRYGSKLSVGIMWDSPNVDLDLYVWEKGLSKPIYFGNGTTSLGRHLRDYRDATGQELEQVVMNQAATSDFQAWVNTYFVGENVTGPIKGKVLISSNGRTEVSGFSIDVNRGNGGANRANRQTDPHWRQVVFCCVEGGKQIAN